MKAVMLSIQPKYCELIANGKKTVEVRKTRPKLESPFKCYIYKTKGCKDAYYTVSNPVLVVPNGGYVKKIRNGEYEVHYKEMVGGKVIGEFICDKIGQIKFADDDDVLYEQCLEGEYPCTTLGQLQSYIGVNNVGYGWHISDLKIYDKPKELCEFFRPCPYNVPDGYESECFNCDCLHDNDYGGYCSNNLYRPPQSWCYVET